jgi:hypothetical protein
MVEVGGAVSVGRGVPVGGVESNGRQADRRSSPRESKEGIKYRME